MATDPLTEPVPAPVAEPPAAPPAAPQGGLTPADITAAFSQMIPMITTSLMTALASAAPAQQPAPIEADPNAPDDSAVEPELEGREEFLDDEYEDDDVTLLDEPDDDRDRNCMGDPPERKDRNMSSAPAATNVRPSGGRRPTVARNQRAERPDRYAALVAENEELKERAAKLDERIEFLENVGRFQARYGKLQGLEGEGYVLDPDQELEDTLDLTDEQFDKHVSRIPDRYQRREPEPASRIRVDRNSRDDSPDRGGTLSQKQYALVGRYSQEWGIYDPDAVEARLKKDHPDQWKDAAGA